MKPTVGQIVHYTNLGDRDGVYPPEIHPALITKVTYSPPPVENPKVDAESNYQVSLRVFYETGDFSMKNVEFRTDPPGSEAARGFWGWPARE